MYRTVWDMKILDNGWKTIINNLLNYRRLIMKIWMRVFRIYGLMNLSM